jgi:hypothetical protein
VHLGQRFSGHLAQPLVDAGGLQVMPAGATVLGHVSDVRPPPDLDQPPLIGLTFDELSGDGRTLPLKAHVIAVDPSATKHGADWQFMTAARGSRLGAIVGQQRGEVAGSMVGAGRGTLISLGVEDPEKQLPAGTAIALELDEPLPSY